MWDLLLKLQNYFLWMVVGAIVLLVVTIFVAALIVKAKDAPEWDKVDEDDPR